jgi:hypothetical protein
MTVVGMSALALQSINVIASEAKQSSLLESTMESWIASSQTLLAMTLMDSGHALAFSRRVPPELCYQLAALSNQRARGGRAPDAPDSRVCNGSG